MTRTVEILGRHDIGQSTYLVAEVPETASQYRLLIYQTPGLAAVAVLNWGTSAEFGELPVDTMMRYSVGEHLTGDNLVDADNLIAIFRQVAG